MFFSAEKLMPKKVEEMEGEVETVVVASLVVEAASALVAPMVVAA